MYIWNKNRIGGLSFKFKTEVRSTEVLNFNERPTMRFLCCLYTYHIHLLFLERLRLCDEIRCNTRITCALMWLGMRSILFHVHKRKSRMILLLLGAERYFSLSFLISSTRDITRQREMLCAENST